MALNVRSILGRNQRPQLTNQDMQTANDHGISSKRVDRPTLAAKKIRPTLSLTSNQDDAPPMGMARPRLPIKDV